MLNCEMYLFHQKFLGQLLHTLTRGSVALLYNLAHGTMNHMLRSRGNHSFTGYNLVVKAANDTDLSADLRIFDLLNNSTDFWNPYLRIFSLLFYETNNFYAFYTT